MQTAWVGAVKQTAAWPVCTAAVYRARPEQPNNTAHKDNNDAAAWQPQQSCIKADGRQLMSKGADGHN